jgi:hypothetical protein
MGRLVEFPLEDGGSVLVEVDAGLLGRLPAGWATGAGWPSGPSRPLSKRSPGCSRSPRR